jgi:hypothetical protein
VAAAVELLLEDGAVVAALAELLTRAAPRAPPPSVEPTKATATRPFLKEVNGCFSFSYVLYNPNRSGRC